MLFENSACMLCMLLLFCFIVWPQTACSDTSRIFEQRLTAMHEHLTTVSDVVAEIADDVLTRKHTVTSSSHSSATKEKCPSDSEGCHQRIGLSSGNNT